MTREADFRNLWHVGLVLICFSSIAAGQFAPSSGSPAASPPVLPTCLSGTPGTLKVDGNGRAEATADVANVVIAISSVNETAEGARQMAAESATQVFSAVRQVQGIQPDNVTTNALYLQPKYSGNSNDDVQRIVGYTFTNLIGIAVGNLTNDLLSEVVDTAIRVGGNNVSINSVTFTLSPGLQDQLNTRAEILAVNNARAQAQRYAQNFGIRLGPVLTITTNSYLYTPTTNNLQSSRSTSSSYSTPINVQKEPRTVSLTATFTICSS